MEGPGRPAAPTRSPPIAPPKRSTNQNRIPIGASRLSFTGSSKLDAAAKTVGGRGGADLDPFNGPLDHIVLPAQLFGVHLDHTGDAKTEVHDDIDPAVAGSALADAYREYARTAKWVSGDAVLYIGPDIDMRNVAPWDRDVSAKVGIELAVEGGKTILARLEATDTDGFAVAFGTCVTNAVYRG